MNKRVLALAMIAFLGMVDASYISMKRGGPPVACHVTKGCNDVLTSSYSALVGIPISWFGLVFYLFVFACSVFELSGAARTMPLLFWPALLGFLISLGLTGIQAFVLRAYCEFCLLSALFVTAIFTLIAIGPRRADA